MELSRIGFGSLSISGFWNEVSESQATNIINHALDKGINWIDTSPLYGNGYAENIIAKIAKNRRDDFFIANKCGRVIADNGPVKINLSPSALKKELTNSLKRLKTSNIDLYQCHVIDEKIPIEETWQGMSDLVKEGVVKYIGVCNYNLSSLKKIQNIHPVYSIQLPFNIATHKIAPDLIRYCSENNIKIISYSPLQSGLLSGNFDLNKLNKNDMRLARKELFSIHSVEKHLDLVNKIKPIALEMNIPFSTLAISWILQNKFINNVILGMTSTQQLDQNIQALAVNFTSLNLKLISRYMARIF